MSRWEGLDIETEGTGISRPLSRNVNLLGSMLGEALRARYGEETLGLVEDLRLLCREAERDGDASKRERAAARVAGLDLEDLVALLRAFTSFFHLVNQAEKQEIIRVNRERAREGGSEAARPESIAETHPEPGASRRPARHGRADARPPRHPADAHGASHRGAQAYRPREAAQDRRLPGPPASHRGHARGEARAPGLRLRRDPAPSGHRGDPRRPTRRPRRGPPGSPLPGGYHLGYGPADPRGRAARAAAPLRRRARSPGIPALSLVDRQRSRRQSVRHRRRHAMDLRGAEAGGARSGTSRRWRPCVTS